MDQFDGLAASEVNEPPLDQARVAKLLKALRRRTPREITIATIGLGGCFSREMWHALELLAAERSASGEREITSAGITHEGQASPIASNALDEPQPARR